MIVKGWDGFVSMANTLVGDSVMPYSLFLIMGIIFSYLVGVVLGTVGYVIVGKEWRKYTSEPNLELPDPKNPASGISYIYDFVQHKDPPAGARLANLSAERTMCWVLGFGFFVLIILHAITNRRDWQHPDFWIIIVFLISSILSVGLFHKHLLIHSRKLMLNYWHMLNKEENQHKAANH